MVTRCLQLGIYCTNLGTLQEPCVWQLLSLGNRITETQKRRKKNLNETHITKIIISWHISVITANVNRQKLYPKTEMIRLDFLNHPAQIPFKRKIPCTINAHRKAGGDGKYYTLCKYQQQEGDPSTREARY